MKQFKNIIELVDFIRDKRERKTLLTFHSIGDTDAVSSALVLAGYFEKHVVVTPDIITSNANRILDRLGLDRVEIPSMFDDTAEMIILLDTNNFEECGQFQEKLSNFKGPIVIIDHHLLNNIEKENVFVFNNERYCATANIVYLLVSLLGKKIGQKEAKLLLTGIISDSAELRNSTPETFIQIGELLKIAKVDYYDIRKLMSHERSAESRASAIKDMLGAEIFVKEGLVFAVGIAHAHANLAADNAIRLGADISIFYSENEKEISFSARLNTGIDKSYGIHLGKIMRELSPIIKGVGGGHPAAAGAYGPLKASSQEFLDSFFEKCIKKVKNSNKEK